MRTFQAALLLALTSAICFAIEPVTAAHGTVSKIDSVGKTMVVKTKDGTEHTIHFLNKTVVHGTETGVKESFAGVKEGSEVVVHYTTKGTEKTAVEVDKVGKEGLQETEGTVSKIDQGAKTIAVKTADGSVQTFQMADHATEEAGKDVANAAEKSGKVTVYYTTKAGKKVVHFFER